MWKKENRFGRNRDPPDLQDEPEEQSREDEIVLADIKKLKKYVSDLPDGLDPDVAAAIDRAVELSKMDRIAS